MLLCLVPVQTALQPPGEGREPILSGTPWCCWHGGVWALWMPVWPMCYSSTALWGCLHLPFPTPSCRSVPLPNLPRAWCPAHISHFELSGLRNYHFSVSAELHSKLCWARAGDIQMQRWKGQRGCDSHAKTGPLFSHTGWDLRDFQGRSWTLRIFWGEA